MNTTMAVYGIKDPISALTHFFGIFCAIAGLIILLFATEGASLPVASFSIFGGCAIGLYLCSTLYHLLQLSEKVR